MAGRSCLGRAPGAAEMHADIQASPGKYRRRRRQGLADRKVRGRRGRSQAEQGTRKQSSSKVTTHGLTPTVDARPSRDVAPPCGRTGERATKNRLITAGKCLIRNPMCSFCNKQLRFYHLWFFLTDVTPMAREKACIAMVAEAATVVVTYYRDGVFDSDDGRRVLVLLLLCGLVPWRGRPRLQSPSLPTLK